jgi:predicted transcriptional regulator
MSPNIQQAGSGGLRRLTFRVPADLHKRVSILAVTLDGESIQSIGNRAIERECRKLEAKTKPQAA